MIKIKVSLENCEIDNLYVDFSDVTIEELLAGLNIDLSYASAVLVDGTPKKFSDKVCDKTEIYVLPMLYGG